MSVSPYFLDLGSAYQSEMDDLRFDSEGQDVLHQRLAGKRQEMAFLVQMMDTSPEMVAVVFHQGFDFTEKTVMEHLLTHDVDADGFPAWSSLANGLVLAPWAQDLAHIVLQAPGGDKFLTLTAGLEYMAGLPVAASIVSAEEGDDDEDEDEDRDENGDNPLVVFEGDDEREQSGDARARHEAGSDWLVQQGFDAKD
ncbi:MULTISPECIES: hypothetical protein [unclassified Polaromonas]|uniref:hypothetical protein n=1 Tax=unclassified Polaromonas TaxID=2638319 RepID=UPI000F083200|nr:MULTISPECIES: hypothetical protein [unclassified Polaromonas]AYQ28546.1 hypothetical protein DT070_11250 [Polaromonas sp. SP1]QGJ20338.1 hypothetical protein F7R28_19355 [Polaromonas sp. Pch-P]